MKIYNAYSAELIFEALQRVTNGERVLVVARSLKISDTIINAWRKKFSGHSLNEIQELRNIQLNKADEKIVTNRQRMILRFINQQDIYAGRKIFKLTAIKFTKCISGNKYWSFQCDCGNIKEIRLTDVLNAKVGSCGCLRKESWRRKF